eukprot:3710962-Prymnesium_polylepis.1
MEWHRAYGHVLRVEDVSRQRSRPGIRLAVGLGIIGVSVASFLGTRGGQAEDQGQTKVLGLTHNGLQSVAFAQAGIGDD